MNILVVNDDGIKAVGVHKLAEALAGIGTVYICAPACQQSATGHGITIGRVVAIADLPREEFPQAAQAIAMDGTPADCVKIGLEIYRDRGVTMDAVFSGFNHGMNLGTDTLYSGTVSAAMEAGLGGLPGVALSITSNLAYHKMPTHFDYAMRLTQRIARRLAERCAADEPQGEGLRANGLHFNGLHFICREHTILSVNIPDLPDEEIRGLRVVPLSYREYDEWFDPRETEDGRFGYHYSGTPCIKGEAPPEESDIIANREGFATITPLHFDLTDHRQIGRVRAEWDDVTI
ncbi:MAG: 5'/3'-nucleotidase SurE [Clostridiales bacterium]|nr:5'/3'-nucleotidase SurE [Clostridiales bacterium]